jgi:hypothetical protein
VTGRVADLRMGTLDSCSASIRSSSFVSSSSCTRAKGSPMAAA